MIPEVNESELDQIHKVVKWAILGDKKVNGYAKHVLKTIQNRLEMLEKKALQS